MTVTLILSLGFLILLCYTPPGTEQKSKEWQNDPQCGSPRFKPATNGRIVGGANARAHSWPWHGLLRCQTERLTGNCGGTLISKRWIVTAAHCLPHILDPSISERNCYISLGKHSLDRMEVTQQTVMISEYIVHEDFIMKETFRGKDLALLKLEKDISYNEYILPICLPFGLPEVTNQSNCYATGFGIFDTERRVLSTELKQLSMPIADVVTLCGKRPFYANVFVCAGSWLRGENICNGDSGGPLTCKENNGKWYLRGVASLADKTCQSYGVFTNVNFFKDWIESKITSD